LKYICKLKIKKKETQINQPKLRMILTKAPLKHGSCPKGLRGKAKSNKKKEQRLLFTTPPIGTPPRKEEI